MAVTKYNGTPAQAAAVKTAVTAAQDAVAQNQTKAAIGAFTQNLVNNNATAQTSATPAAQKAQETQDATTQAEEDTTPAIRLPVQTSQTTPTARTSQTAQTTPTAQTSQAAQATQTAQTSANENPQAADAKYVAKAADGSSYYVGSETGGNFITGAQNGATLNGADGSTWAKDNAGNVTITDKYGKTYSIQGGSVVSEAAEETQTTKKTADDYLNDMKTAMDAWLAAAKQQSDNSIDYNTQKSIDELTRAEEDAQATFRQNQEQIVAQGQNDLDNQALYAEARGDKGGIGQAQYNAIMNTMAINQQTVKSEQTKLATDTQRQIADLRAQGEYEKADAVLQLTQTYLGELVDLQQWAADYALTTEQFDESVRQWEAEYETAVAELTGEYRGSKTLEAQEAEYDMAYKAAQAAALYGSVSGSTSGSTTTGTQTTEESTSTMEQIDALVKSGMTAYDAINQLFPKKGYEERKQLASDYESYINGAKSIEEVFAEAYQSTSPQSVLNQYKDTFGDVSKDYATWAEDMDAQYDRYLATAKTLIDRDGRAYGPQVYATIMESAPAAMQKKLLETLAAYNSEFRAYLTSLGITK